MKATIPLGRLAGIGIGAHWSVLVTLVLLVQLLAVAVLPATVRGHSATAYWVAAVVGALLFFASLLAHEIAHALVARHFGVHVERITLWLLGGVAQLKGEPPTPRADLLIAGVGPVVSLAAGGVFALAAFGAHLLGLPTLAGTVASWLAGINLLLGVFNLLPGAPLDGGRVLRAALWKRYGDRERAAVTAARVGQGLGTALIAVGFLQVLVTGRLSGLWLALVGWFLTAAAAAEKSGVTMRTHLTQVKVGDVMTAAPVVAPGWWTVDAFLDHVAATSRHRVFPVVDFDGRPTGVVSLAELARVPRDSRAVTRVGGTGRGLTHTVVVSPADDLGALLGSRAMRMGNDLVLVIDDGQLVGVVSPSDLARVVELGVLGRPPVAGGRDGTGRQAEPEQADRGVPQP